MLVRQHIVAAAPLAIAVFTLTGSIAHAGLAALSSILIDLDHVLDYLVEQKHWGGLRDFFGTFDKMLERNVFFLHSWELVGFLIVGGKIGVFPGWVGAAGLGMGYHLVFDQIAYAKFHHPMYYFFFFRAAHRFRTTNIYTSRPDYATRIKKNHA
jgi:hypothetical protein